jgi:hypothetical protein
LGWQKKHFIKCQNGSRTCRRRNLIYSREIKSIEGNYFSTLLCSLTQISSNHYGLDCSVEKPCFHWWTMPGLLRLAFHYLLLDGNVAVISIVIGCDYAWRVSFARVFSLWIYFCFFYWLPDCSLWQLAAQILLFGHNVSHLWLFDSLFFFLIFLFVK